MRVRILYAVLAGLLIGPPAFPQYKLNGFLSARYEKGKAEADYPEGTFGWVKAGLLFTGRVESVFNYGLEVQLKSENRAEIEEAWVGINPAETFQLKLGCYLVPFGRYNAANRPYQNPFIQTPLPQGELYPDSWRDIGVLAEGRWSSFGYSVYMGNGLREGRDLRDGQQFKDNNGNKSLGGRVSLMLGQGFEIAGSYYKGKYDDAAERNLKLYGADASWSSESFMLLYEYGKAELDNPAGYGKGANEGHFALAALNISRFMVLAGYQTLKYEDPYHGWDPLDPLLTPAGIATDRRRWSVGLAYLPAAGLMLKVGYDFNREKPDEIDDDVLLAQVS
ncbi:MAG: porin, partial [Candidatus Aminicenantes bacterium]|nr:porin [Candidatus Aminicenantes bacterium]